jgi:hypothetical protein
VHQNSSASDLITMMGVTKKNNDDVDGAAGGDDFSFGLGGVSSVGR